MSRSNLDHPKTFHEYDLSDFYEPLAKFGRHFEKGFHDAQVNPLPLSLEKINSLIICTDGASRHLADFSYSLVPFFLKTPFEINTNFRLPSYANENTLVLAISSSNNSEELSSVLKEVETKNIPTTCLVPKGNLFDSSHEKSLEVTEYQNLPHTLGFLFGFFFRLNPNYSKTINQENLLSVIEKSVAKFNREVLESENTAKSLPQKHSQKAILVFAAGHLHGVASLFSGLIIRLTKTYSKEYLLPEVSHFGEAMFTYPHKVLSEYQVLILGSDLYPAAIQEQQSKLKTLLTQKRINYSLLKPDSSDWFEQILESVVFLIFFSYYLSIVNKVKN